MAMAMGLFLSPVAVVSSAGFPIPTSLASAAGHSVEDELLPFPVSHESPSAHAPAALRPLDFLDYQPPRLIEGGQPGLHVESANGVQA